MKNMKLTSAVVRQSEFQGDPKSNSCILWDSDLPGFGVRLYPSGKKAFIVDYRSEGGRRRRLKVGAFPTFTVEVARKKARALLAEALLGKDPLGEREERRAQATVTDLCKRYMSDYAKKRKRSHRDDKQRIEQYVLPAFGSRKVSDVKRSEVAALHTRIGKEHPYAANRVLSLISMLYKQADVWGLLPEDHPNPARNIRKHPEKSRERFLTEEEVGRLLKATDLEENERFRHLIRLYLLTGAREQELLHLRWDDVQFDSGRVTFRGTKAGRDHYIKPSEEAMVRFRRLHEIRDEDNPYVFPGRLRGQPLRGVRTAWSRVLKVAKLNDVHMHDLRRTAASWLAQNNINTLAISNILNHTNVSVTQVYARMNGEHTAEPLRILGALLRNAESESKSGKSIGDAENMQQEVNDEQQQVRTSEKS